MNESPFGQAETSTDLDFLQALCQEMMMTFKGKAVMSSSLANFAGNSLTFP